MNYKKKFFFIEKVKAIEIVKKIGTPTYVYSSKKIIDNIKSFKNSFKKVNPIICFSVKSNCNSEILNLVKRNGLGADVVSKGELLKALKSGIPPKKIVFSGVGKTKNELELAIDKKILLINSESENEIRQIEIIAKNRKRKVDIGIRLNPNTDAKTLNKISTGKIENKFGVDENDFLKLIKKYRNSKNLNIRCISVHIGSQITKNKPYEKMLKIIKRCIDKSDYHFDFIDLGGGMGIKYDTKDKSLNYKKYSSSIIKILKQFKSKIIFEPGRSIVANAGFLLSKIIYVKDTSKKKFIIIDAGMNDLIRPALYNAKHRILAAIKKNKKVKTKHEFVGPICETSDKFLFANEFQPLDQNDILIICDVGAYGIVLSSNYNLRPIPAELMVNGSNIKIIRKRQEYKEFI